MKRDSGRKSDELRGEFLLKPVRIIRLKGAFCHARSGVTFCSALKLLSGGRVTRKILVLDDEPDVAALLQLPWKAQATGLLCAPDSKKREPKSKMKRRTVC